MDPTGTLTTGARRFRTRRRRFLLVTTAALAAVATAMGISFTADTGTSTVTATAGSTSPLVYQVKTSGNLPPDLPPTSPTDLVTFGNATTGAAALKYGTVATNNAITGTVVLPSWSPVAGTAGTVTTPGDLFVIDGRTTAAGGANHITVTVYVTNLAGLQAAYSSFAWPVDLYVAQGTTIAQASWHVVDSTHPTALQTASGDTVSFTASDFFLTNTGGFISYYLPTGADLFYEIALDNAGSYYTVNTSNSDNLNPTFFVTAQAT